MFFKLYHQKLGIFPNSSKNDDTEIDINTEKRAAALKQGNSYGGTQETAANSDNLRNPGNFLAIAPQVTHCYLLLYEHIHSQLPKDVSDMSPTSQNQLTGIVAKYMFQK